VSQSRATKRPPGTWASGRSLSDAQRERKRQTDRAGKSKRRRDDQRLVEGLKAKVAELTAKVKALEEPLFIQGDAPGASSTTSISSSFQPPHSDIRPGPSRAVHLSVSTGLYAIPSSIEDVPDMSTDIDGLTSVPAPPLPHETALIAQSRTGGLNPDESSSTLDLFNHLLAMALVVDRATICLDEASSQDAMIRGILYGWPTVLAGPYVCPLWQVLGQFDELVYGFSSVLTRLTVLKVLHTFMLVW
jgi:hypothetical protein